jgi:hypothetical protein
MAAMLLAVVVVVKASVLFLALAVLAFASCGGDGQDSRSNTSASPTITSTPASTPAPEPTPLPSPDTAVARSEADRLQVCIDVSPAASPLLPPNKALKLAYAGLPRYEELYQQASDMTKAAGAEAFETLVMPLIHSGCPDGYIAPPAGADTAVKPQAVDTPSLYHLHIFVGDDAELAARIPAGEKFFRRIYERQCYGLHTCAEVTTALYVPLSQMRDPSTVGWVFAEGTTITPILRYPCGHPDPAPKCQGIRP